MKARSLGWLTIAVLIAGCAGSAPASHSHGRCTASSEFIDDYVSRLAGLASNESRGDVLEPHEAVYVSFALAADGTASDFRSDRPSRPAAAQEVVRAAAAAAPYPKPPFDPEACLWNGRVQFSLIGHTRCDDARVDEYTEAVGTRLRSVLITAGLTGDPEPDKVTLKVKIDDRGKAIAITVHDAKSRAAGERVAALARTLSPFAVPDDSVRQCVADHPFFIWVELPGVNRPPIPIREY